MPNSVDFSGRPFHFIGIGGIGMSALAYILAKRKLPVSGSDIRSSHITQRLETLGVTIFANQDAANLEFFHMYPAAAKSLSTLVLQSELDSNGKLTANKRSALPQVICSTAINSENLEYQAALDLGCPIFHRSDVLAGLIAEYKSIAVAGTHGKTTTSSMIGYMLLQAGLDPTIVVGGEVDAWEGNARLGQSEYLVAEADESDGSLVKFSTAIGVVTNIELDHPDHYKTLEEVVDTFQIFAARCQTLVGCLDCATVRARLQPAVSYSIHPQTKADYTVSDVVYRADGTSALVWEHGELLGELNLRLLGQHNLSNAIAAVAVGRLLRLDFSDIAIALSTFTGARRRFELRGEANGILFIDDYAHHPSELQATLNSARLQAKTGRVVAIFQPHRYSRTLAFLTEFAQSFHHADLVVISDIYSAGEPDLGKVSSQQLVEMISEHQPHVTYQPTLTQVCEYLTNTLRPGDMALFLGAGNLNSVIPEIINSIRHQSEKEAIALGSFINSTGKIT